MFVLLFTSMSVAIGAALLAASIVHRARIYRGICADERGLASMAEAAAVREARRRARSAAPERVRARRHGCKVAA